MSKDTDPNNLIRELEVETGTKKNMKLWKAVEKTPPDMTKPVSYGKRKYTTIDPQYQLMEATRMWGPYGERWGLRKIKYNIVEIKTNDKVALETKDAKGNVVSSSEVLADFTRHSIILEAEFYYPGEYGEASFPIINDDKYQVDDDVLKKLITNTRSKALSYLGFSADVFLGKFDDTTYVEDLRKALETQDRFVATASAKINSAKDMEELGACKIRLKEVEAESKVDAIAVGMLEDMIKARERFLLLVAERKSIKD